MNGNTCETVIVKGQDGGPLRINKSDYEANKKGFTLYKGKDAPDDSNPEIANTGEAGAAGTGLPAGVTVQPPANPPEGFNAITTGDTDADHMNERNAEAQRLAAEEDARRRAEAEAALNAPKPGAVTVEKFGAKWRGVDASGNTVDENGYRTEAEAKAAYGLA